MAWLWPPEVRPHRAREPERAGRWRRRTQRGPWEQCRRLRPAAGPAATGRRWPSGARHVTGERRTAHRGRREEGAADLLQGRRGASRGIQSQICVRFAPEERVWDDLWAGNWVFFKLYGVDLPGLFWIC